MGSSISVRSFETIFARGSRYTWLSSVPFVAYWANNQVFSNECWLPFVSFFS